MHYIEEILRLRHEAGRTQREIASGCGIAQSSVHKVLAHAKAAGLGWPLPEGLDEPALHELLFGQPASSQAGVRYRAEPDFEYLQRELQQHKHLTLQLLWEEYRGREPGGYGYSRFCDLYRKWRKKQNLVMRQEHRAGEKVFVDYAGATLEVDDAETGRTRPAQIFVAVLGASSYTYAEASWSQELGSWIDSHVRAFQFYRGCPQVCVPDNLRSGVTRACLYQPEVNRAYREMARLYGVAVVPARPRKPRDKAKAEAGVQLVERWILAALRHERFTSLGELNERIRELTQQLNQKPFRKRPESRASLFRTLDQPALRALPAQRYEHSEWLAARVHPDYHVQVCKHFYSVPCELVQEKLDVRLTLDAVEFFHQGRRVAAHARSREEWGCTTLAAHQPRAHRQQARWTPERMKSWAAGKGPGLGRLAREILDHSEYPRERYREVNGLIRLADQYGVERMEAAARRALHYGTVSYRDVKAILESGADRLELEGGEEAGPAAAHENVRGPEYYEGPGAGRKEAAC
jgi:transposase